jgi:hypothetical protein
MNWYARTALKVLIALAFAGLIALTWPLIERDWNTIVEWWSR